MDQLADTNRTRMKYLSLLATTIGSEDLAIVIVQLGDKLILRDEQENTSIDRWVHSDCDVLFRSQKSGNKIIMLMTKFE